MSDSATIQTLRQALADAEAQHGLDHMETAQAAYRLAIYRQRDGHEGAAEAEALALRACDIYEATPEPYRRIMSGPLSMLASLRQNQGRKAEAEALFRRAIELRQVNGEDTINSEEDLNSLGCLLHEMGRFVEATEFLVRGLRVVEQESGADYQYLGTYLRPLSRAYIGLKRYDDAIEVLQRELDLCLQHRPDDTDTRCELLEQIAAMHAKAGRPEQADETHREAFQLRVQLDGEHKDTYGHMPHYDDQRQAMENLTEQGDVLAERNDFASAIAVTEQVVAHYASRVDAPPGWQDELHLKLARWNTKLGRFDEAETLLNQSREYLESKVIPLEELHRQIIEKRSSWLWSPASCPKSSDAIYAERLGWVWHELGLLHEKTGRSDEALHEFEKAIEIWKVTHDIVPGFVSSSLFSIGAIHGKRGDWNRASELTEEALEIERALQPDSSFVAKVSANLALVRQKQGRIAEAAQLRQTAAEMLLNNAGPGELQVSFEWNEAGKNFLELKDWERAKSCFQRSLALLRETNPILNQPIVTVLQSLSNLEIQQAHFTESLPYLREALSICESDPNTLAREYHAVLRRLTESLLATEHFDEAETAGLRWLAYLDKNTSGDEPELPAALGNLAQAYYGLNQYEPALRLIERAIPLVERHARPNDPSVAVYSHIYANILGKLGRHPEAKAAVARARQIEALGKPKR